jgi:hypothetical protein
VAVLIGLGAGLFLHFLATFIGQILRLRLPAARASEKRSQLTGPTPPSHTGDKKTDGYSISSYLRPFGRKPPEFQSAPVSEVPLGYMRDGASASASGTAGGSSASSSKNGRGLDFYYYEELLRSAKDGRNLRNSGLISTMILEEEENHESDESLMND